MRIADLFPDPGSDSPTADWLPGFIEHTARGGWQSDRKARAKEFSGIIEPLQDSTLKLIRDHYLPAGSEFRYYVVEVVRELRNLFGGNSPWIEDNIIAMLRIVPDDMKSDSNVKYYIPLVMSFFSGGCPPKDKISEYDDALLNNLRARLRLTYKLSRLLAEEEELWSYDLPVHLQPLHGCVTYSREYSGAAVLNDNLIRATEVYRDRIYELVDVVLEHRTDDLDRIAELLSHPSALGKGAL